MLSIAWRIVLLTGFGLEGEPIRKRIVYIMRGLCSGTWILALMSLGTIMSANAGVTVIQNVAPGAMSWSGSPTIITMLNPSSATTPQTFTNSGSGFTTMGQTFTVTSTNYILKSIEIYAGGGVG